MAAGTAVLAEKRAPAWSLVCGIAAPPALALAIIMAGLLTPGYNHVTQTVSRLGVVGAPYALLLNGGLALYGILISVFAYGLYQRIRYQRYARLLCALLAVYGIGTMLVGVFPDNVVPNPGSIAEANLHNFVSLTAYLAAAGAMGFVVLGSFRNTAWRGLAQVSGAAILLIILLSPTSSMPVLKATEGLWQRLSHLIVLAWVEMTAIRALRQDSSR